MSDEPKPEGESQGIGRLLLIGWLHLMVLWSFAVAKPLLDVVGRDPAFFVARDNTGADIVLFAVALTVLPPLLLIAIEAAVSRWRDVARVVHLVFVGLLAAVLAIQLIKGVRESPTLLVMIAALAVGGGFAYLYSRGEFLKSVLTVLSPIPLVFIALFLFSGSVSALVSPDPVPDESAKLVRSDAPVVELVFDEFPLASLLDANGKIDASRYPGFAELAARSTWYQRDTTVAAFTHFAVPAILSGQSQPGSPLPTAAKHPKNLFTVLAGHRQMNAYEAVTRLCPEDECGAPRRDGFWKRSAALWQDLSAVEGEKVLPPAYAEGLPHVDQGFGHFFDFDNLPEDISAFEDFLEGMHVPPPSQLSFFHALLPHVPWHLLPDGHVYSDTLNQSRFEGSEADGWAVRQSVINHFWERHLLQVGFADRMVQQLIARLKRLGIWDRALVVVTADHGAAFYPHRPRRDATPENAAAILRVPLFIKAPGQTTGRVSEAPICSSDVLPRIGGMLGIRPKIKRTPCDPRRVVVYSAGKTVTVHRKRIDRGFEALLRRQARFFPSHRGWGAIYRSGDRFGLIGRKVGSLPHGPDLGVSANLGDNGDDRSHGPDDAVTEVLVSAGLSGPVRPGKPVAIAVGNRIEAIGVSYYIDADGAFGIAGVLPPSSLNEGPISLYWIGGGDHSELQLIPLEE
ncbi:MAG: hypothetical protein EXQ70_01945 [Solirubrobacterales bacterium]|nr:hypothetical protein [Solirubrobacterales bacterium]